MIPVVLVLALVAGAVYVDHRLDQVAAGRRRRRRARARRRRARRSTCSWSAPTARRLDGTDDGDRRSDTIMVVHVDPSARSAQVLSLPRDLVFDDGTADDRSAQHLPAPRAVRAR